MKGRKVFRDNHQIYEDLYYIWTYVPDRLNRYHDKRTKKSMYKKHICGIGFYSRYHAKHVPVQLIGAKVLRDIHIIKGDRLIKQGITTLKGKFLEYIFVDDKPHHIKRWVYPQEFRYDSHRRRHFIVYLVSAAEDRGVKAFNKKYKRYFYGYRESFPWSYYRRKIGEIRHTVIQKVWKARGFDPKDLYGYEG